MKKYKVEFTETQKYIVDVRAKNEENARKLAEKKFMIEFIPEAEDGETVISCVYDVTNTDDPFNP